MILVLLDPRWPDQVPLAAIGAVSEPLSFTDEVPIAVRWNADKLLSGLAGEGTLVSTDPQAPEVREAIEGGARVIRAASLDDPQFEAREAMRQANRIGEWERGQTHESLLPYLEEEAAEFADSVRAGESDAELLGELGDVYLQVLFHAEIASRRGAFTMDDVARSFTNKLRSRSPYLFDGTTEIVPVEEQERLWAEGKAREKRL